MLRLARIAILALSIFAPISAAARVAPPTCDRASAPVIRGERRRFRLSPWVAVFSVRNRSRSPIELTVRSLAITAPVHVSLTPARIVVLPDARLHGLSFEVDPRRTERVEVGFDWPPPPATEDHYAITATFVVGNCPYSAVARVTRAAFD